MIRWGSVLKTRSVGIQSARILVAAGEDIVWINRMELVFEAHYLKVRLTKFVFEEKRKQGTYLFGLNFWKKLWDDNFEFVYRCTPIRQEV